MAHEKHFEITVLPSVHVINLKRSGNITCYVEVEAAIPTEAWVSNPVEMSKWIFESSRLLLRFPHVNINWFTRIRLHYCP
jgi:hypothetical protein